MSDEIEVEIPKDVYLECFHHLLPENNTEEHIDIEVLWGGRDSGKSRFVAQLLIEEAMSLDYFRCILIKETHDSVKDAQWQNIKDIAESWNVDHLFRFRSSPLGISCVNGNNFLTRGLNEPGRIRSINNPSHAWVEEANQISEEGFITLLTSLRSDYGPVKLYLTLNPEATCPDYTDFFLYKLFFKDYEPLKNFKAQIVIKVPDLPHIYQNHPDVILRYRCTHVTYHDNPYVPMQRIAIHESLQQTNYYWYRVFTLGLWGNQENDSPWAFAFDMKKHVGYPDLNRAHPVILSFDFNRNPFCCSVIQNYDDHARVLETIKLAKSGVDAMCEYILVHYPGCLFMVTGDYSGMTETSLFQEQVTHYLLIKHYLKLNDGQIKVEPNPRLQKNSTHVNTLFVYYQITFHAEKARALIFDCQNVKRRADGTIVKVDRDDPAQQSDALDTWRYFCNIFLGWFKPHK